MSRALELIVPEALRARLEADPGSELADGFTLLLLTLRDDGWPHQAMVSVGEVICAPAAQPEWLRLAVWPQSTSTHNLHARGRATLTAVADGVAYALFLQVAAAGEVTPAVGPPLARFDARIVAATADEAPYAQLESGIRFTLTDRADTLARWRATREALSR